MVTVPGPMSGVDELLLGGSKRDGCDIPPALQTLLQLAYSDDTDNQIQAVMGISQVIERHPVSAASFGPLCHTLSCLVESKVLTVVAYAARGIKILVLDDSMRPHVTVAGIPRLLATTLRKWKHETVCSREILGALQTLCCDKATVQAVINTGAVGSVLELLGSKELELKILATAISANVLSFSESPLLTNEACIADFSNSMGDLLNATNSGDGRVRDFGVAAVMNACAHPVLARRARNLGAVQRFRILLQSRTFRIEDATLIATVIARLTAPSTEDIEGGAEGSGGREKLQLYTFKWGVHPFVETRTQKFKKFLVGMIVGASLLSCAKFIAHLVVDFLMQFIG